MDIKDISINSTVKVVLKTKDIGLMVEGLLKQEDNKPLWTVINGACVCCFHQNKIKNIKYDQMNRTYQINLETPLP